MKNTLETSMMERLQLLPLFLGMANSDMRRIMEKLCFDFAKVGKNEYIVKQDDTCDSLIFILAGAVLVETESPDQKYTFTETLPVPSVLQPEMLFGPQTRYNRSYKAEAATNILRVSKKEFWKYLVDDEVFRLNFINSISAEAQNAQKAIWSITGGTLEQRLIRFILRLCRKPVGRKNLFIKMQDLAFELSETRANISKTLNQLEKEGLMILGRATIEIPHMEQLYARL